MTVPGSQVNRGHPRLKYENNKSEMGTFEWDILNPDRIINLEIKNEWRTSNI